MNLKNIVKTLVDNLQYSLIFKITKEISNEDIFVTRQELDKVSDLDLMSDPISLYREAKTYFINRAIDDDEVTQKLVEIPEQLKLNLEFEMLGLYGEGVIELAKESSIITLLLYMIPRIVIGTTVTPQEFRQQGVDILVKQLLSSSKTRKNVITAIEDEMVIRKLEPVKLEISSFLKGYDVESEKTQDSIASTIALTMIMSTGLPFTKEEVLDLPIKILSRETTAYILSMHALSALKKFISGTGRKKSFEWPITGDKKACTQVIYLLEVLRDITSSLRTCPMFVIELMSQTMKMGYEDYIVLLLDEIVRHYEELLRKKHGKGKNEELRKFIKFISEDRRAFARRLMDSPDKGLELAKELRNYKRKTKSDVRIEVTPETRYLKCLESLDGKLRIKKRSENFSFELVEDIRPVFDLLFELVKKNESNLQEDVFKFTDALCFQTCFQILEYVKLGETLIDLPWISRFIAEEAVRSSISSGELQVLGEEHRTKRIIAAYLGGLSYIILQAHNA